MTAETKEENTKKAEDTIGRKTFKIADYITLQKAFRKNKMKYGISIGRRQPMHKGHMHCIRDITNSGLIPIILIGSANTKENKFYDPLRNPLTIAQQVEQINMVMEEENITEYYVIPVSDVGDMDKWTENIIDLLAELTGTETGYKKCVLHFISKFGDIEQDKLQIKSLSAYKKMFESKGVVSWQSSNASPELDKLHATTYRSMPVSSKEFLALPAGEYIAKLCLDARENNGFKKILESLKEPVTMRDLTLLRLKEECGVKPDHLYGDKSSYSSIEELDKDIASKIALIQAANAFKAGTGI